MPTPTRDGSLSTSPLALLSVSSVLATYSLNGQPPGNSRQPICEHRPCIFSLPHPQDCSQPLSLYLPLK